MDANHAIYRALLEETDSASGVFEGTIEYQMLNQRTVDSEPPRTEKRGCHSDELVMILDTELHGQRRTRIHIRRGQRKRGRADEHR